MAKKIQMTSPTLKGSESTQLERKSLEHAEFSTNACNALFKNNSEVLTGKGSSVSHDELNKDLCYESVISTTKNCEFKNPKENICQSTVATQDGTAGNMVEPTDHMVESADHMIESADHSTAGQGSSETSSCAFSPGRMFSIIVVLTLLLLIFQERFFLLRKSFLNSRNFIQMKLRYTLHEVNSKFNRLGWSFRR